MIIQVRTLLARHYLSLGMVEESEEQCVSLLQKNKTDSESATLVSAGIVHEHYLFNIHSNT